MNPCDKNSGFWLSDCGKYIARSMGGGRFDVFTVDGHQCWLSARYVPKGDGDKDPRAHYPEFAHMVNYYGLENDGSKPSFKLGFDDMDTTKRIETLTGNCIIKSYEATFSRQMKMRAKAKLEKDGRL